MNCRIAGSVHLPVRNSALLLLRFELLDERSEMRRDGSREGVVLVLQRLPNYCEPNVSIASGIHLGLRRTWNDMPPYPVVDPVSCGGEMRHGPLPTSPPPIPRSVNQCADHRSGSRQGKNPPVAAEVRARGGRTCSIIPPQGNASAGSAIFSSARQSEGHQ